MNAAVATDVMEPMYWRKNGWTARVIKNHEDDGWAVEITRAGDPEPALVGHWTMGRDKKNPKPIDEAGFATLVKTATEVRKRHEQAARALLHRSLSFTTADGQSVRVNVAIAADDDDPHAMISVYDAATDELIRSGRVGTAFKLSATTAQRFMKTGES